jgi:alpha-L-fucosidase 2
MLLQSHDGRIRIFPAIPDAWQDVSFTTLRAQGAFLVSARRANGITELVEIVAEQGGMCHLISPFSGAELVLDLAPGTSLTLRADP